MKKIIFVILVSLITFLIYYFNLDRKIYYVSFGDYLSYGINNLEKVDTNYNDEIKIKYKKKLKKYVNYSSLDDYRVMDLINDINYNKEVIYNNNKYKIQNLLIKANLMTISIGMNDLIYRKNIDYDYVDDLLDDIEKLLILIRKYNKDKIYFLGFYNIIDNESIIKYSNIKLSKICERNKIKFVDISNLNQYIENGYPNNNGYTYITNQIFTK